MPTILMTGAAGRIGTMLRTRLARPGRTLRLLDIAPVTAGPGEEAVQASVTDLAAMTAACQGADAVIHLGRYAGGEDWASILDVNINGGYTAFEAARRAGVSRVIYASSNHAVGFAPRASFPVPDYAFPEPDSYYGISKAATEALASMYHHRYGLDAICVRILTCTERPENPRALSTWLSPDDAGRLFEACLSAPRPGFRAATIAGEGAACAKPAGVQPALEAACAATWLARTGNAVCGRQTRLERLGTSSEAALTERS